MSFFNELKRRNVFRVAIAYTVVAWLIAQVVDLALENFGAPAWFMKSLLVVLAAGLPISVVFAWAFEMTPEGLKKEKDVDRSQSITPKTGHKLDRMIIGVMAVVIIFLVVDRFVLTEDSGELVQSVESPTVTAEDVNPAGESTASVAVLPFINMSDDASNEYFSDGLTETLLHMLAQLPDLHVAARTSSFAFKGKDTSIAEIADTLSVAHILEGSVQKSGNRVRITAQLIRADDGFHVWSQNYDRTLDDIFAIQDEIAADVAGALGTSLLGHSGLVLQGVSTKNTTAYDYYLKALEQQAVESYSSIGDAENLLKNALANDPDFIEAKLALVRNYLMKFSTGLITRQVTGESIKPLLLQVRQARPDDPLARAMELSFDAALWYTVSATLREAHLNEILALLPRIPSDTWVRENTARNLRFYDANEQAIDVIQAGLMLDPLSAELHAQLSKSYEKLDRFDEAKSSLTRALELAPDNPNMYANFRDLAMKTDDLNAALDWNRQAIEKDPQDHELVAQLAEDFFRLGLVEEGARWAARCYALAPHTAVCRKIQLKEARTRKDAVRQLELAASMLHDDIDLRRFSYTTALFTYVDLMTQQGREQEAFNYLVTLYPDLNNFEQSPNDFKQLVARHAGVELLMGFAPRDQYLTALDHITEQEQAAQLPWLGSAGYRIEAHLLRGETDQAAIIALNEDLSRTLVDNLGITRRYTTPLYTGISQLPEVAARIRERDTERAALRSEVETMLLEPEWNQ